MTYMLLDLEVSHFCFVVPKIIIHNSLMPLMMRYSCCAVAAACSSSVISASIQYPRRISVDTGSNRFVLGLRGTELVIGGSCVGGGAMRLDAEDRGLNDGS